MRYISAVTLVSLLAGSVAAQSPASALSPPANGSLLLPPLSVDSLQDRQRAVSHSDFYYKRLAVHRIGSYVILPLSAGEYYLGDRLINRTQDSPGWIKGAHGAVAGAIGGIFAINTITGVWNLVESRHDPGGGFRKYLHSAIMIAADAGIVMAAASAGDAGEDEGTGPNTSGARRHRNYALGGLSVGAVGTVMMWLWK